MPSQHRRHGPGCYIHEVDDSISLAPGEGASARIEYERVDAAMTVADRSIRFLSNVPRAQGPIAGAEGDRRAIRLESDGVDEATTWRERGDLLERSRTSRQLCDWLISRAGMSRCVSVAYPTVTQLSRSVDKPERLRRSRKRFSSRKVSHFESHGR